MQNREAVSTLSSGKAGDASISVCPKSSDIAEASSSSSGHTSKINLKEKVASIDLTAAEQGAAKKTAVNQSKSLASKEEPKDPESPSTLRKYNLRDSTSAEENGYKSSDEDKEDLIGKLFVYKQLPDGSYSCELCSSSSDSKKTIVKQKALIVRHLLRAHTYCFSFECSSCPCTFKREAWLKNHTDMSHREVSTQQEYFECVRCQHKSTSESLLRLHTLRRHAAVYRYVCKCCAKCFKNWPAKYKHEKRIGWSNKPKPKPKPRYVCDKCSRILRTRPELIKHLKDIHAEDFYENGARILHKCKECTKLFLTRKSLEEHAPAHQENDVTGYACTDCGKRLSSRDHLKKHARVHSGERPYACPECGRAFALRTTMRIHALSHRGIKPYICQHCDLGYSQRSALMIHWKSKHKGQPAPPPIEIHQYFGRDGRVLMPC